ncbi:cytochrome P450 monooxygenase CYP63 [Cyathus striatus]|nr:cytochrome P450 monooxygenase CYP63 [Cyathus striatus]
MDPSFYRTRLLLDLSRTFLFPELFLSAALYFSPWQPRGRILSIFLHGSFVAVWATAIPRVVGKWPGNIDVLLKMMRAFKTSYVLDVYLQLFEEYQCTTLNTRILWSDNIISMDQEHAKFVLATGFQHFHRGKYQKERMETFLGEGIFNRDDQKWKMHRAIARPFFARDRILDFQIFETYGSRTISILSSLSTSNRACDVQDLYSRFTLDAASEFLFGKNLNTLSASLPDPGQTAMGPKGSATTDAWGTFAYAFEMCQQNVTTRARIGHLWPLFELFRDRNEPHVKVIRRWIDPLVQHSLDEKARLSHSTTTPLEEKNFLQHLAQNIDDPKVIRDQLLNVLLASRDTTASVLTFITYFMAIYPDVTQKMRAEVLEYCGTNGTPSFEQLRGLKYVRAVINETLRIFPPVPLNVRETRSSACLLPPSDRSHQDSDRRPLYMPAHTTIMYFPLLTQRNPALWGPDADEFKPERWLQPESIAKFVANPQMYTPFSAGPRICVGQNYAYNQMAYFLVRLLQKFDSVTLLPEFQPEGSLPPPEWKERNGRQRIEQVWPSGALTLFIKGGLWVKFGTST